MTIDRFPISLSGIDGNFIDVAIPAEIDILLENLRL